VLDERQLDEDSASPAAEQPRPRTITVLGMLAAVALVFSYLGAYALANALVAAEVIQAWPRESDPRPRWMLVGFVSLLTTFLIVGAVFKWISRRELRQIDEMMEA
jgi:hypothetical protein